MSINVEDVKKSRVLMRVDCNNGTLVGQVIAGIAMGVSSAVLFNNYLSPMKSSIWRTDSYVSEQHMKTLCMLLGILFFALTVIVFIKIPALKKSNLNITENGVYGVAGKSYYFSTVSFTIPLEYITNVYAKGNSIYIESGGDNYRVAIEQAEKAARYIESLKQGDKPGEDFYNRTSAIFKDNNLNEYSTTSNKSKNIASSNEWKCPNCGRVNQNYVGTCGCGEVKPS